MPYMPNEQMYPEWWVQQAQQVHLVLQVQLVPMVLMEILALLAPKVQLVLLVHKA